MQGFHVFSSIVPWYLYRGFSRAANPGVRAVSSENAIMNRYRGFNLIYEVPSRLCRGVV